MNVQMRVQIFRTFMIHLFVHMHQKKKIALEIATKMKVYAGLYMCIE